MGYQVLARKWRPHDFREVVGQQHVLTALVNSLDQGRLHHAWLFSGTRGVGKTTIARILAKCLNCEQGVSSTPCGQCDSCREIDQGNFVDLLEIDAASRTKVEDTRELLENVQYRPARGRFKVYLIDEVHMLSRHSFNALLKTLEEPPPYVKFLLATTDPQKLPITILSRCLQFHLKALSREQIVGQLQSVLDGEGQPYEPPALLALAKAADGSMRDALSLTDQALAHGNGHVRLDLVQAMLGTLDQRHLHEVLRLLATVQGPALMQKVAELAALGPDFDLLHAELAALLHRMALAQLLGADPDPLALDGEQVTRLAQQYSAEEIQLCYQIVLQGRRELPLAPDGRSALEMTLLRMLAFSPRRTVIDAASVAQAQPAIDAASVAQAQPAQRMAALGEVPAAVSVRPEQGVTTPVEAAADSGSPLVPVIDQETIGPDTDSEDGADQVASLEAEQSRLMEEAAALRQVMPDMPGRPAAAPFAAQPSIETPPAEPSALATTMSMMQMHQQLSRQQPAAPATGSAANNPAAAPQRKPVTGLASAQAASSTPLQPARVPPVATAASPVLPAKPAMTAPAIATPAAASAAVATNRPATASVAPQDDLPPWDLPPLSAYSDAMGPVGNDYQADMPYQPADVSRQSVMGAPAAVNAPAPHAIPQSNARQATSERLPRPASAMPAGDDENQGEPGEWRPWQSNDLLSGCGDAWGELIAACGIGGRLRQLALQSSREIKADHWLLTLPSEHRHLVSDRAIAALAEQLSAHAGTAVQLQLQIGTPQGMTPLQIEHARYVQLCEEAQRSLAADPHIQFLIERFGAQLEADSIQPLTQSDDNPEER